jgi:hypothetical protein
LDNQFITDHLTEEQLEELKCKVISIGDYLNAKAESLQEENGESEQEEDYKLSLLKNYHYFCGWSRSTSQPRQCLGRWIRLRALSL